MLENCCAFTGHRPHKFPWKYDEADSRCVALKAVLAEQIAALVNAGVTQFCQGWQRQPIHGVLSQFSP